MANQRFKLDVKKVGSRLKLIRVENKFTQQDLATFLEMTRSSYASIEAGTYGTRIEVVANIILFYDKEGVTLDIEELLGLERPRKTRTYSDVKSSKQFALMVESCNELTKTITEQAAQISWYQKHLEIKYEDHVKVGS